MLARAQRYTHTAVQFLQADAASLHKVATPPLDWILSFATVHHIPSEEVRLNFLKECATRLAPEGCIVFSNWQWNERWRRLAVPWETVGITDVEPNDFLLQWERHGQHGMRYVHWLTLTEVERLAAQAGLRVTDHFRADSGNAAEYVFLRRTA
jgi:SAM-dependent methyltransferase